MEFMVMNVGKYNYDLMDYKMIEIEMDIGEMYYTFDCFLNNTVFLTEHRREKE